MSRKVKIFGLIVVFSLLSRWVFSQQPWLWVMPYDERTEFYVIELIDSNTHLTFKPFSARGQYEINPTNLQNLSSSAIVRRWFVEPMVRVRTKDFTMNMNLLGWLNWGRLDSDTVNYYRNTRGFEIYGNLTSNLFYYTKYLENQAVFYDYLNRFVESSKIVPGEGWWKPFGQNGRDYGYAVAHLAYQPLDWLELRIGHGKNFVGNGYRSLLLSDNSFVYPYFGLILRKGKWQLVNLWAEMYRFKVRYYWYHYSKHATFNVLSYRGKFYELAFFQAVMWKTSDYATYVKRFPALFFMPILALPFYGLDNQNNVIVGADFSLRRKTYIAYAQLVVDKLDFNQPWTSAENRFGYQIGIRTYDVFLNKLRFLKLSMLWELNHVRPFTYQSQYWNQNYAHYNQALAHTLGAGFTERIFSLQLRLLNLGLQYKWTWAKQYTCEPDCETNIGTDVFDTRVPGLAVVQTRNIVHQSLIFWLVLHSDSGLSFYWGMDRRRVTASPDLRYVFFGIKTYIGNLYYDF